MAATTKEAHPRGWASFDPLPFDARAARAFGRVAAGLRRSGRKPAAGSYDAAWQIGVSLGLA
ncbi:MAG: hypothetical protein KJZ47_11370, partial [Gemmatimonadales bacterium]|nr:hypothetical protein [Gemmatimonadales bacterium]